MSDTTGFYKPYIINPRVEFSCEALSLREKLKAAGSKNTGSGPGELNCFKQIT